MHVDQITEMAAVMRKAIEIDEKHGCKERERIIQLEVSMKSEQQWHKQRGSKCYHNYFHGVTVSLMGYCISHTAILLHFPSWRTASTVFPTVAYSQVLHR